MEETSKDIFQAVRTAQVVNLAQTGGRIRLIIQRAKLALREDIIRETPVLIVQMGILQPAWPVQVVHRVQLGGNYLRVRIR